MATLHHEASSRVASELIETLGQPERTALTELRMHGAMPPFDTKFSPDESLPVLSTIYQDMLPKEWDTFSEHYRSGGAPGELLTRLSFICTIAQLGRVLIAETIRPGYERAVDGTVMLLWFNLDMLTEPVPSELFERPYEELMPVYDAGVALGDITPNAEVDTYFDTVLLRIAHAMTQFGVQHDLNIELGNDGE